MSLALHFLSARSSVVRGETGGLETCFTGRSSSRAYSDTYVVREGQKLSNTTENPISTLNNVAVLLQT